MQKILENKIPELRTLCHSLRVKKLFAFGSVVSGDFREESDIDFLISFADNLSVKQYTENYFALQYKLRDMFNRNIDLITERTLSNPYFIESIEETKQLIYEA